MAEQTMWMRPTHLRGASRRYVIGPILSHHFSSQPVGTSHVVLQCEDIARHICIFLLSRSSRCLCVKMGQHVLRGRAVHQVVSMPNASLPIVDQSWGYSRLHGLRFGVAFVVRQSITCTPSGIFFAVVSRNEYGRRDRRYLRNLCQSHVCALGSHRRARHKRLSYH